MLFKVFFRIMRVGLYLNGQHPAFLPHFLYLDCDEFITIKTFFMVSKPVAMFGSPNYSQQMRQNAGQIFHFAWLFGIETTSDQLPHCISDQLFPLP
jgi:hypothetical protein